MGKQKASTQWARRRYGLGKKEFFALERFAKDAKEPILC